MTVTIFIPRDAGALALGAERVAEAIETEISERGIDAKIVRNGSRGMFWLEPLVEVETPAGASPTARSRPRMCRRCSMPALDYGAQHTSALSSAIPKNSHSWQNRPA